MTFAEMLIILQNIFIVVKYNLKPNAVVTNFVKTILKDFYYVNEVCIRFKESTIKEQVKV